MRAILIVLVCVGTVGCYKPDAPSGSYLCGEGNACPDGLSCTCGLCVSSPEQAACSFGITSAQATGHSLVVKEHQRFPITITAYADTTGTKPSTFTGSVTLSSSWGDVCVGGPSTSCLGLPNQVPLTNGTGGATVQLNRETVSPQSAVLTASFAGNTGDTGQLRITVDALVFGGVETVVAPTSGSGQPFASFADNTVGPATVVKTPDGWSMYFYGSSVSVDQSVTTSFGVATSTDGLAFTPTSTPIYTTTPIDKGAAQKAMAIGPPSARLDGTSTDLYFAADTTGNFAGYNSIERLTVGSSAAPSLVFGRSASPYAIVALEMPMVIADPDPLRNAANPEASILFASALFSNGTVLTASVLRALSSDGTTFTIDPAPVLQSTLEEPVIYAPHVLVDGTTYKMYYSTLDGILALGSMAAYYDFCKTTYYIGYATSSDGTFWVRSAHNASVETAVFEYGAMPAGVTSALIGAVVPADGVDPSTGLVMYFTPYQVSNTGTGSCQLNGVMRAVSQ